MQIEAYEECCALVGFIRIDFTDEMSAGAVACIRCPCAASLCYLLSVEFGLRGKRRRYFLEYAFKMQCLPSPFWVASCCVFLLLISTTEQIENHTTLRSIFASK